MGEPFRRPTIVPAVYYEDAWAALNWLEAVFGFERSMVITDKDGKLGHSEMRISDGLIYVGTVWAAHTVSPAAVGARNTQAIHVHLTGELDAHCARARAAGAEIVREPEDQFYGDRVYAARDPEGHVWTFGQTVEVVSREEAEARSGLVIEGWV